MPVPEIILVNGRNARRRRRTVSRAKTIGARVRQAARNPRKKRRAAKNPSDSVSKKLDEMSSMFKRAIRSNPSRRRRRSTTRSTTSSGAKKMATRRRKRSLPRDSKGHFLPRGRKRRVKAKRGPSRKRRARRSKSRRNPARARRPAVRRRRRARRNPLPAGMTLNPRRKSRRRRARRNPLPAGMTLNPRRKSRRHRARRNPSQGLLQSLNRKIGHLAGGLSRAKSRKPSLARTRLAVLKARRRVARGGVSSRDRHYMAIHGFNKVRNAGSAVSSGIKAFVELLPEVGAGVGGGLALWGLGVKGGQMLVEKWGAGWAPYASAGVSLVGTLLAFIGIRMTGMGRLSAPLLIGGAFGTVANALSSIQGSVPAGGGPTMSLGRQIGLPLGDMLTPGLSTGLHLSGSYMPRADFAGAYVGRENMNQLSGSYMPRADFSGLRGYLPVGATKQGESINTAMKGDTAQLRSMMREHVSKMGDGPGF